MDVRVELWRKLSTEELMLLNYGVGEDCWKSLGLQGDPTSPSYMRPVLGVHWKDSCWSWNSNTLATSCEELTQWKRPWCWEGLGAGGEGDDWGWDGWMASPTWWIWVWVNSGSLWWTGRPGVLRFMGSERVGTTEQQNWTDGANSKKIKEQAKRRVWGTPDKGISSTEAPRWHQWQQSNLEKMTTCSAVVYLASSLRPVWVEERKWRDRMQVDKEEMGRENTWSHSKDFDLPCLWNRKLWEGFEQQNEIN